MTTKLGKAPCKIWLDRKVKFFNNSGIFKGIELEFGMETNFGPLKKQHQLRIWRHNDVSAF